MHMDLLIENELKEEIYNLILEELTVNNEVLSSSKTVEEEIIEQAKKMNSIVSTNIHSQDEIKRNSAEIVYLANPYEQDCYVSSVYSFVKNQLQINDEDISKLDEFLKKTDAYGKIYRLKELFKIISDNKDLYKNEILETYDFKRWDRFYKYIRNAIHRFEKKFAMVTKKCKNDFFIYESHTWCEGPDFKKYYKIF